MFHKLYFDTLPSTNQFLKDCYQKYFDHTVIICNNQTSGRGRENRRWEAKINESLSMSILLKPDIPPESAAKISLMTSAAVFKVISSIINNVSIKWPNDILVNDKKVCGILLESIMSNKVDALIIGIGININNKVFPKHLSQKATSLFLETHEVNEKEIIIDEILKWFEYYYDEFLKDNHSYIDICRKYSSVIGKNIIINGNNSYVLDILDNGNILVKQGNDNIEYSYGELTLEQMY